MRTNVNIINTCNATIFSLDTDTNGNIIIAFLPVDKTRFKAINSATRVLPALVGAE